MIRTWIKSQTVHDTITINGLEKSGDTLAHPLDMAGETPYNYKELSINKMSNYGAG